MMKTYIFPNIEAITPQQLEEELLPALPVWRRNRALEYRFHLGRVQCAMAFLLLKEGLNRDFGITDEIAFDYLEHQKPVLRGYPQLHFNISHCKKAVLCVIDDEAPVGCDVESLDRNINDALIRKCCNETEISQIQNSDDPRKAFVRLWTIKEAVLKCIGRGLVDDLPGLLTSALLSTLTLETHEDMEFIYTICRLKKEK